MNLPFFFCSDISGNDFPELDKDTARHIIQVLRMAVGESLHLTDGCGHLALARIEEVDKKHCRVSVVSRSFIDPSEKKISIAVSPVKNAARFEWFLEKASEIGVQRIVPLICTRTERQVFKAERWTGILKSAMLQSQQVWMPALSQPIAFADYVKNCRDDMKMIAHCVEDGARHKLMPVQKGSASMLIGPEGDFTFEEIDLAISKGFLPVALGATRLRTETAALVASVLMRG